jgi:polar amino acid transport system substrate-binding protein
VLIGGGIAAGLRREDTELRARFDAAISTLKQDGSLNAMIDKWFPGAKGF